MQQPAEAEPLLRDALAIRSARLPADDLDLALSLNNLAALSSFFRWDYQEAEPLYLRALAIREARLGSDHEATLFIQRNLAGMYVRMKRYGEAEQLYRKVLHSQETLLGRDDPATIETLNSLASLTQIQDRNEQFGVLLVRHQSGILFRRSAPLSQAFVVSLLLNLAHTAATTGSSPCS